MDRKSASRGQHPVRLQSRGGTCTVRAVRALFTPNLHRLPRATQVEGADLGHVDGELQLADDARRRDQLFSAS